MSKRLGFAYRAGRVDHWLKIKNPAAPHEAEDNAAIQIRVSLGEAGASSPAQVDAYKAATKSTTLAFSSSMRSREKGQSSPHPIF